MLNSSLTEESIWEGTLWFIIMSWSLAKESIREGTIDLHKEFVLDRRGYSARSIYFYRMVLTSTKESIRDGTLRYIVIISSSAKGIIQEGTIA